MCVCRHVCILILPALDFIDMQITLNKHLPIHISLFRVFRIRLCLIFRIVIICSSFTHTHNQKSACLEQFLKLSQTCQTTEFNSN